MRILLTGSRAPATLELTRALAGAGHTVFAADSFSPTVCSHSRRLRRHFVIPPPRTAGEPFAAALLKIVREHSIDWIIPTCEEVFHVARHYDRLTQATRLLCPPLEELDRWHNKSIFQRRAAERGLLTPRTECVDSPERLEDALHRFPRYLLKPVYSRFATRIITNVGPRAGALPLAAAQPSPASPWLVQEFIDGASECSYSVVHDGRITAHCAYRTPHTIGAGVSFLSIEGEPLLAAARALLEGARFTGQFSLDAIRTASGSLCLLECNPRTTSGVHVMPSDRLAAGLLGAAGAAGATWVAPPGSYQQLLFLVLAQNPLRLARNPPRAWRRDAVLSWRDPLPAVMQLAQLWHFFRVSRRRQCGMLAATTEDIEWNGPDSP